MEERWFWVALEFRICGEFAGLSERRYRYFWCDGFAPKVYALDDTPPRITGIAWICNGRKQAEWDFTLLLPRQYSSVEEIDWDSLLPPSGVTRWMCFDESQRTIEIEPSVAVPDLW